MTQQEPDSEPLTVPSRVPLRHNARLGAAQNPEDKAVIDGMLDRITARVDAGVPVAAFQSSI